MSNSDGGGTGILGTMIGVLAIPFNLLAGLILGLVAPIAAIAAMVAGVRLVTGMMPFLSMQKVAGQERSLALTLVPADQVKERFEEQKEEISTELAGMQQEIRAIIEEAKRSATQATDKMDEALGESVA